MGAPPAAPEAPPATAAMGMKAPLNAMTAAINNWNSDPISKRTAATTTPTGRFTATPSRPNIAHSIPKPECSSCTLSCL
jgi:hypothetical protein